MPESELGYSCNNRYPGMYVEWLTEWMEIKRFNSDEEGRTFQAALSNQLALQGLSWYVRSDHASIYHVFNLILNLDPSRALGETKTPFQFFQSSGGWSAFYFLFSPRHLNTQSCWSFQDGKNSLFIVSRHQPRDVHISAYLVTGTLTAIWHLSQVCLEVWQPPPPPHF